MRTICCHSGTMHSKAAGHFTCWVGIYSMLLAGGHLVITTQLPITMMEELYCCDKCGQRYILHNRWLNRRCFCNTESKLIWVPDDRLWVNKDKGLVNISPDGICKVTGLALIHNAIGIYFGKE